METIGTHGLSCQTGEDFAALALYMQVEAERIDALLTAQRNALTGFLVRPTIIVTNSANVNMAAGGGSTFTPWDTVVFNNSTFLSLQTVTVDSLTQTAISVGSIAGAAVTIPYLQGWYRYGFGTRMTATGAINAYSSRTTDIFVTDDEQSIQVAIGTLVDTTYDTSTGGEAQNASGTFIGTGTSGIRLRTQCTHGNTSSSVNLNTNSYLWVTYIGPNDPIEVA